jgi:predicted secreted hydrolase
VELVAIVTYRLLLASLLALFVVACTPSVAPLAPAPAVTPTPVPPAVSFPRDADPHDTLMEWWYYTGHLRSDDGREFGFEFTIFQTRREGAPAGYMAHFAISDIDGQRFSHQARFTQAEPQVRLPLDVAGWSMAREGDVDVIEAQMLPGAGAQPAYSMQLRFTDEKPPALHHGGYIDMGPAGGSYYYSRTRLHVSGTLGVDGGAPMQVDGQGWMDHQWGNFVVAGGGGWDWFSLQLDDDTDLMLYPIRGPDGSTTAAYGTLVQPDGAVRDLAPNEVQIETLNRWTSPHTGAHYPSGWRISLSDGQQLTVMPRIVDQELYFPDGVPSPVYWEGAVSIEGDRTGLGYVELTGYAD